MAKIKTTKKKSKGIEDVYSPIHDEHVTTNLNNSKIWKNCYKEDEYKQFIHGYNQMYCYTIRFEGTQPIQVNNVKKIK